MEIFEAWAKDIHDKLHAQTSTLWTLCAALTETWPIGQRLRLDLLGFRGKILMRWKINGEKGWI